MKDYIEERAINIANYIIESNATVRQTAREFGVSKSTVHADGTIGNGLYGWWSEERDKCENENWSGMPGVVYRFYHVFYEKLEWEL